MTVGTNNENGSLERREVIKNFNTEWKWMFKFNKLKYKLY